MRGASTMASRAALTRAGFSDPSPALMIWRSEARRPRGAGVLDIGLHRAKLGDPLGHVVAQREAAGMTPVALESRTLIGVDQQRALGAGLGEGFVAGDLEGRHRAWDLGERSDRSYIHIAIFREQCQHAAHHIAIAPCGAARRLVRIRGGNSNSLYSASAWRGAHVVRRIVKRWIFSGYKSKVAS